MIPWLGPQVVPFYPFLGVGSTTKIDYGEKKDRVGTLILTSLLEDLVGLPTSIRFSWILVAGRVLLKKRSCTFFLWGARVEGCIAWLFSRRTWNAIIPIPLALGQHPWYHFGVGAPPLLEPMGMGCSRGATRGFEPSHLLDSHVNLEDWLEIPRISISFKGARGGFAPWSSSGKHAGLRCHSLFLRGSRAICSAEWSLRIAFLISPDFHRGLSTVAVRFY